MRSMVFYDSTSMSLQLLELMRVLVRGEDGILRIRLDDVAEEEGTVEPEPQRVQRRRPALRGAHQGPKLEIYIRYLAQNMYERFDIMERRQQWYGDEMVAFFIHQGFHYLIPFPPPYQQRHVGARTSGAQRHDDKDDE